MADKSFRSMRTPLARVRGLGSAKEGVHHWWAQRLTALALVPLTLWFVVSVAGLAGMDHAGAGAIDTSTDLRQGHEGNPWHCNW